MAKPRKIEPYLSLDFGDEGGLVELITTDTARQWVTQLIADWNWVASVNNNPAQQAWGLISNPLSNANNIIQQSQHYQNQNQEQQAADLTRSAKSSLEGLIRANPWILQGGVKDFLLALKNEVGAEEASIIVAHLLSRDLNGAPLAKIVSAMMRWEFYVRGIKDRFKTENASLKKLVGSLQTSITKYEKLGREKSDIFDDLNAKMLEESVEYKQKFEEAQQLRDQEWKAEVDAARAELQKLNETYDQYMTVAAPVDYWEDKRKKHARWAKWTFAVSILAIIGIGWFLSDRLEKVFNLNVSVNPQADMTPLGFLLQSSSLWHIGTFVLLTTLSLWVVRIIVRLFLSHTHLENDAAERVTMAKTYLALIRDGALNNKENIGTVLAALFRPTGDGIVKDEGLPPTAMEWLTKLSGKD